MSRAGSIAMSMASSLPPAAVLSAIALPVPMFAMFAALDNAAPEIWDFLTTFGVAAAPVGIGLAIAAHVLGKRLGSLVGRIDRVTLSRERYIAQHELSSLHLLLTKAIQRFEPARADTPPENCRLDGDTALKTLSHLHAIRSTIISSRLPKVNNTDPLQEIDYAISAIAFSDVDHAGILELVNALKNIRAVVMARMKASARA